MNDKKAIVQSNISEMLCLFSNASLLNLNNYINTNNESRNKIGINDQLNHLFNLDGEFILSRTNFYNLIKKHSKKQRLENEVSKEQEILKAIAKHIAISRNYHSHNASYRGFEENKGRYEQSIENLQSQIKQIIRKSSVAIHFDRFGRREWDAFFIQMFLHESEWNEFYEKARQIFQVPKNIYRKFRIRLRKVSFKDNTFDFEVVNYIKTFNKTINRKKAFLNIAIKMLNYFLKPSNLNFTFAHKSRRGLVVNCKSTRNAESPIISLNLQGIRRLLLYQPKMIKKNPKYRVSVEKHFETKNITSNPLEANLQYYEKHHKLLMLKISDDSKLPDNHLLKILGKTLRFQFGNKKEPAYQNGLGQTLFNQLLQFLQSDEKKYLEKDHTTTIKLMEVLATSDEKNASQWKAKIKVYLREAITADNYKKIFKAKELKEKQSKARNIWSENPKLSTFLPSDDESKQLYHPLFDFTNSEFTNKSNLVKKLIAPVLVFYHQNRNEQKDWLNDGEIIELFAKESDLPITFETIKKCFAKRISKTHSKLITYNPSIESEVKINIENDRQTYLSNYELVNSKLFLEVALLLAKGNRDILTIGEIIKKVNEYQKNELLLIKWALKNESNQTRNLVMHRSISKFSNWSDLQALIKNKPYQPQLKKGIRKSQQRLYDDDLNADMKKFTEKNTK